ncbi:MAG: EamA family transporter [Candidatus Aenigmarchaeota archaeon]|nr:EamA family transporter [Candidatus Aenigmarchaeota archaeon]
MGLHIADINWGRNSCVAVAVAAGIFYGLVPVLLKIASADIYISPYLLAAAGAGVVGFFLMQKSMHLGNISTTISIITALNILTAFVFSIFVFNEYISYVKWIGAIVIIIGVIGVVKK